jgi:hypothetical protein
MATVSISQHRGIGGAARRKEFVDDLDLDP